MRRSCTMLRFTRNIHLLSFLAIVWNIMPHLCQQTIKATKSVPSTRVKPRKPPMMTWEPFHICPVFLPELQQTEGFGLCKQGKEYYLYKTDGFKVCREVSKKQVTILFKLGMLKHGCPRQVLKELIVMFEKSVTFTIPTVAKMPLPCDSSPCLFGGTCKDLKIAKKKKKQQTEFRYWCKCLQPGYRSNDNCQRCAPGRYGIECRELCSDCANPSCNYTTGDCPQGKCASEELRPPKCETLPGKNRYQPSASSRKRRYHAAFGVNVDGRVADARSQGALGMLKRALANNVAASICEEKPSSLCADINDRWVVLSQTAEDYSINIMDDQDYDDDDGATTTTTTGVTPRATVIARPRQRAPASVTSATHHQGAPADRTLATHRQRAPAGSTTIRADITMQIPEEVTQGREDFADVIAANLKQNAPNFDLGDGYSVDVSSIEVTELAAVPSGSSTDSSNLPHLPMIVSVLCVAVIISVILFIALRSLRRNTTSRNIRNLYPDTEADHAHTAKGTKVHFSEACSGRKTTERRKTKKQKPKVTIWGRITPKKKLEWKTSGRLAEERLNEWKDCFEIPEKIEKKKRPEKRSWVQNWHMPRNTSS